MPTARDLERMKEEYAGRNQRLAGSDRYSAFNMAYLFSIQQRQRKVLELLHANGFDNLSKRTILEVGCGTGSVLLDLMSHGAQPRNLFGIDLLQERLCSAHNRLPHATFALANGEFLPYPGGAFDLVMQFTAFSSILDEQVKQNVAAEMLRTLKPGGMIVWYDFWINPTNRQTRGIGPAEVRRLFPGCRFTFKKVTLAPPIARRVVPFSWGQAVILEALKILNSHYLAAIRPADA